MSPTIKQNFFYNYIDSLSGKVDGGASWESDFNEYYSSYKKARHQPRSRLPLTRFIDEQPSLLLPVFEDNFDDWLCDSKHPVILRFNPKVDQGSIDLTGVYLTVLDKDDASTFWRLFYEALSEVSDESRIKSNLKKIHESVNPLEGKVDDMLSAIPEEYRGHAKDITDSLKTGDLSQVMSKGMPLINQMLPQLGEMMSGFMANMSQAPRGESAGQIEGGVEDQD